VSSLIFFNVLVEKGAVEEEKGFFDMFCTCTEEEARDMEFRKENKFHEEQQEIANLYSNVREIF
jgi:hypothetical protein